MPSPIVSALHRGIVSVLIEALHSLYFQPNTTHEKPGFREVKCLSEVAQLSEGPEND